MFWLVLASTNCKLQNRILYVMLCWVVLLIPWVNFMMNSGKCISSIYMVLGIKTKCWRWASISMAPTPSPVPPSPIWLAPSPTPKMPKIKIKRSPKMLWFLTVILHECLTMLQAAVRVKILFWHRCSLVLIVLPLEIFGPKRLIFYLRIQVALDMGLAWFRNCKVKPHPPSPPAH